MSHTITETRQRSAMWVYENNYACLMQLFPFLFEEDGLARVCAHHLNATLVVSILEQCRYTQEIEIKQILNQATDHLPGLKMKVRVYHDAQLAEVIGYQGHARLLSKYPYPNQQMFHRDEKRQANYLLNDWLDSIKDVDFSFDQACLSSEV